VFDHFALLIYDRYAVFYENSEPLLYVRDLELIKRVMVKDFDHFTDFGFMVLGKF